MIELPEDYGYEILRVEVGSTLHGTGLGVAHEDHDEMGIYIEWPDSTIGLDSSEHYIYRTAQERAGESTGKFNERSQPGDTDLVVYSLRKWCKLALYGNPSVLLPLFAPDSLAFVMTDEGRDLRSRASMFISKVAGKAFLGYMQRQRERMTGARGAAGRIRRSETGEIDWKYAMHMLRLGYQGCELLSTGKLVLPIEAERGDYLRSVRLGHEPLHEVVERAELCEHTLKDLIKHSPLPDHADRDAVQMWMVDRTLTLWSRALL